MLKKNQKANAENAINEKKSSENSKTVKESLDTTVGNKVKEIKVEEIEKKSTLVCQNALDLQKLCVPLSVFVPMTYEERLEEVCFCYDLTDLKSVLELKKEEKKMQYQFLINFAKLWDTWQNYSIPLTEENVYYDENFLPFVKHRDLYSQSEKINPEDFLITYKTFIGGILGQKYSIKQLQESGLETLKDEASFDEFYQASSAEALVLILRKRKENYEKNLESTKILVGQTAHRFRTIISIVAPIFLLITLAGFAYSNLLVIPYQEKVIQANEAFVRMDFVAVIDSLEGIAVEEMSVSTKYILAVSYARGQSLQQEEITRIVSRLTVQSNERELEYWIYLGRLDVRRAQDLAMALSDDQLLM